MRSTEITLEAVQVKLYHADETRTEYIIPKALFDRMLDRGINLIDNQPLSGHTEMFLKPFVIEMIQGNAIISLPFYNRMMTISSIRFTASVDTPSGYNRVEIEGYVKDGVGNWDFSGISKIETILASSSSNYYLLPSETVLDHFKATKPEMIPSKYSDFAISNEDGNKLIEAYQRCREVPISVVPAYFYKKHNRTKIATADITFRIDAVVGSKEDEPFKSPANQNAKIVTTINPELISSAMKNTYFEETHTSVWDEITVQKVRMMLDTFGIAVSNEVVDDLIDIFEFLYEADGNPTFNQVLDFKNSIKNRNDN